MDWAIPYFVQGFQPPISGVSYNCYDLKVQIVNKACCLVKGINKIYSEREQSILVKLAAGWLKFWYKSVIHS